MPLRDISYWEAVLPPQAPPSRALPERVDVLIVGAGFMGRWLAYFLSSLANPPRTLVIERDRFSYGASSRNAGFLTCGQLSEMIADVAAVGVDTVIQTFLARRRGIEIVRSKFPDLEIDNCGSTDFDEVSAETHAWIGRLNEAAGEQLYSVRDARMGNTSRPATFNRADGGINPVNLLRLLQERSRGVQFGFGLRADLVGDGIAQVAGREVRYGRAFLCTNAFARDLDPSSPVVPGRGQIIVTSPVQSRTDRTLGYLNHGYDYFRFVDGRLLLGGGRNRFRERETSTILKPTTEVRGHLEQVAARVIGHANWRVEYHWAGIMGFIGGVHLGGTPRRRVDDRTEAVAGFGGMGVALAPGYAQEIAGEM
jgi:glycine/D-amino acid oxidase-like deaminating enzyme